MYRFLKIAGISVLAIGIVVGVFLYIQHRNANDTSYTITQPTQYTNPLVIAVFDLGFGITPVSAHPAEYTKIDERTIKYIDAYDQTDVVQTRETARLKEDIVLKQPGHPTQFQYQLNLDGLEWEKDSGGNIHFYKSQITNHKLQINSEFKNSNDKNLRRVFTIPAPFMVDANGEKSATDAVSMTLSETGFLTLTPNPEWLSTHSYPIILDPTVEISILNIESHPQQGDDWVVDFTTIGQADLTITPADQDTIDDDVFVSLTCDGEIRNPQILDGDGIYYPDWQCNGVGEVVHYTEVAGKHHLIFDFGGQTADAYNDAGDAWWDTDFEYRKEVNVYYGGSEDLTQYQVMVDDLDTAALITAGKLRSDCGDLRFTATSTAMIPYTIVGNSCDTTDTEVWVQTDSLMQGATTTFYMYYGNAATTSADSIVDTFSYNEEKIVAYQLNDNDTSMSLISLEDGNSVTMSGTTHTLTSEGDTATVDTSNEYDPIYAKKLFNLSSTDYDIPVPVGWAGTEFVYQNRTATYNNHFVLVSPWGTATVYVYAAGVETASSPLTVTSSGYLEQSIPDTDGTLRFVSDIPIIINKSSDAADPYPMHPATLDAWFGWDSTTVELGIGTSGTNVQWIDSNDSSSTSDNSNNPTASNVIQASGGSYYSGETIKVIPQNYAIGVSTTGDSDGGDATTFAPRYEFGTKFGSANVADFVSVVSDQQATCTTTDLVLLSETVATLESTNTEVYSLPASSFGTGNSNAFLSNKWKLECSEPVWAVSQPTADEQNMFSYPMMRQFTYPTPYIDTFGSEETVPSNATPTISGTTKQPNPVFFNTYVGFIVDWDDTDVGELVKTKICKTDSLTNQNCDGGFWASSSSFALTDPQFEQYITQPEDEGAQNYYAFVCDDDGACSSSSSGSFTVVDPGTAPVINNLHVNDDIKIAPRRSAGFDIRWTDADGHPVKVKVCKTNSLTNQNCDGGFWASTTRYILGDMVHLMYNIDPSDAGQTHAYTVFLCDINEQCTIGSTGSFTVQAKDTVPNTGFR